MGKKDLGIKIASKEEKYWNDLRENFMKERESLENQAKLNNAIIEMIDYKIQAEKEKFK